MCRRSDHERHRFSALTGAWAPPSDAPAWSVNGGFVLLENDPGVLACPF